MKLNNIQKNFCIFFSVIISILIAALVWEKITLPLNNTIGAKGFLVSIGYNPTNDTIRYVFFISLPLIAFLFLNQILYKKNLKLKNLIDEKNTKITNHYPLIIIISSIFIIFIFLEFFSVNYSFSSYRIDQFHDGNYLSPFQNYISTKNIWISSQLTHGASDIFYPVLMWKILGVESIGATRTFGIFLILFLKLLSVLLAYQLTKILNLNKATKIFFFTILTAIILSMSRYTFLSGAYYLSYRDIFIILFLIFFIELFIDSKFRFLSTIIIAFISVISILFHTDIGIYINFILIVYCLYLLVSKKYKDFLLIFLTLIACWVSIIILIGLDEFLAFLNNIKIIALSIDLIHGLKYPQPFFSIGENPDGARATRGLLIQITAGLFVLNYLISNNTKIFTSKKVLFLFLFILSLIMYKNALGRSDASHIRGSNDLPILINCIFILNYLLIFFEKIPIYKNFSSQKVFFSLSIFFLLFYYIYNHNFYKIDNIKNYKQNFTKFIRLNDKDFLDEKTAKLIEYYKQISKKDNCVEIVTFDDAIPYLLKKPSCTKYWSSLLASSTKSQKDYIKQLKKNEPEYILYYSDDRKFDGVGIYERIELVNSFILTNYKKHEELDGYIILKKR